MQTIFCKGPSPIDQPDKNQGEGLQFFVQGAWRHFPSATVKSTDQKPNWDAPAVNTVHGLSPRKPWSYGNGSPPIHVPDLLRVPAEEVTPFTSAGGLSIKSLQLQAGFFSYIKDQ